jgi:hypothetical protein
VTSYPAETTGPEDTHHRPDDEPYDFVPLIQRMMADRNIHFRELAQRSGIGRSRLGLLLHSDPSKRPDLTLREFQRILRGLDVSLIQAIISAASTLDQELIHDERFATLLSMLAELFQGLPTMLIRALADIDGLDGTEIRRTWAAPLTEAVVEKLVREVTKLMARRDVLTETSRLGL